MGPGPTLALGARCLLLSGRSPREGCVDELEDKRGKPLVQHKQNMEEVWKSSWESREGKEGEGKGREGGEEEGKEEEGRGREEEGEGEKRGREGRER